ncbi:hypothetical protein LCM00_03440 [Bacillus infantis]|uniref:hypothetical protein n=1 Tax=Bacillus infantis TaxID=324767 RepID=UPI001CD5FAA4|nr:hypothetical protein [Bacillus infantis]MCA1038553.1 hypothetical protein [Bacillus infantis]
MRFYSILAMCPVIFLMAGCTVSPAAKGADIVEKLLESTEQTTGSGIYQEKEVSISESDRQAETTVVRSWNDPVHQKSLYITSVPDGSVYYTAVNSRYMTMYKEGSTTAKVLPLPGSYFSRKMPDKEASVAALENLRETHSIMLKGDTDVKGKAAYWLSALPKDHESGHEEQLWISKKKWRILKTSTASAELRKKTLIKEEKEIHSVPMDEFQLPEKINAATDYDLNWQAKEVSLQSLPNGILLFEEKNQINLFSADKLQSSKEGYRLSYTKDGREYMRLTGEKSAPGLNAADEGDSNHYVLGHPVSIYPIPETGILAEWNDGRFQFELIIYDPYIPSWRLKELLETIIVKKG